MILTDTMHVEMPLDIGGLGHVLHGSRLGFASLGQQFLIEHVLAKDDAVVADVDAGTGDQLFHFRVRLAAKAAESDVRRTCHRGGLVFFVFGQSRDFFPGLDNFID